MSIERSIPELEAWYAQYDDISYRRASPDAYHHELLRTAEALRQQNGDDDPRGAYYIRSSLQPTLILFLLSAGAAIFAAIVKLPVMPTLSAAMTGYGAARAFHDTVNPVK
jgi:hypothetical protein